MKILVIGSAGMLGHVTYLALKEAGHNVKDISFPNKRFATSEVINLFDLDRVRTFFAQNKFDMIINCAGLLIKDSEKNMGDAIFLNSYFPHWLERNFIHTKTKIVQVGTDGVFNGGVPPYTEKSAHLNPSIYARTKSLGEINNDKDLTVRSSFWGVDCNPNGQGLLNWFLMQSGSVNGYTKVFFTGVSSLEFAKFINEFGFKTCGIYNLTASEGISKYELLCRVRKAFKKDIVINKEETITENMLTLSQRKDVNYVCKSFKQMLKELQEFYECHKELYSHYCID